MKPLFYKLFTSVFAFILLMTQTPIFAQGCADAGFCTMGAMRPDQNFSKKINLKLRSAELSHYIGITKLQNTIRAYQIDLNVGITNKLTAQFKIPYMYTSGKLGKTNGWGDISVSLTGNVLSTEKYQVNATVGMKTWTNTQDLTTEDGLPLPMYYQTSLGTTDFVLGLSYITKKWLIATGWQKPLSGSNNNNFWWKPYEGTPQWWYALRYAESIWLRRSADLMFRVQRDFRFSKWAFSTGMLFIYRPNEDTWWNKEAKVWEASEGSDGLAWTFLTGAAYNFNTRSSIKVSNGFRIIRRDHNPDGLSREYVNTISYLYKF